MSVPVSSKCRRIRRAAKRSNSNEGDKVKTAVAKKDAAAKKLQIAGALKTILAQARASYKQQTSDVKSKYEQITTTEAQNILKGV